jgi:hypothetical protein
MKKPVIAIVTVLSLFLGSALLISDKQVHKSFSYSMCKESLYLLTPKPSSVEINHINVLTRNMSRMEIKDWIISRKYSKNLEKSILETISKYKMEYIAVSIDYSAEETLIGIKRNNLLCTSYIDIFNKNRLETITYHNKDYSAKELFFIKEAPSQYNSIGTEVTYIDRVKYILFYMFKF